MSTYLGYTLAFIVIGLFAGYVSKRDMPGGASVSTLMNYAVALAGALAGGLFWLALRSRGWNSVEGGTQGGHGPEGAAYAHLAGDTTQPGYWIGLFIAVAGTLFALAVYRLFVWREDTP